MFQSQYFSHPTPGTIAFMLACHFAPDPITHTGEEWWNSMFGRSARQWLRQNDLIDENHRATKRGIAWVESLIAVPLPALLAAPGTSFRVRYSYPSTPTNFYFEKNGPRKHRRWPSREAAQAHIDSQIARGCLPGMTWEIVE